MMDYKARNFDAFPCMCRTRTQEQQRAEAAALARQNLVEAAVLADNALLREQADRTHWAAVQVSSNNIKSAIKSTSYGTSESSRSGLSPHSWGT